MCSGVRTPGQTVISTSPRSRSAKYIADTKLVENLAKCRCILRGSLRNYRLSGLCIGKYEHNDYEA